MTESMSIAGGCYCGRVRFEITGAPTAAGICHCESCRRTAGAESVGWAVVETSHFAMVKGKPRPFESSEGVERTFCEVCGSSLTYRRRGRDFVDVTLATLDDPEALPPTKETWCRERVSWNSLNEELAHHDGSSSSST